LSEGDGFMHLKRSDLLGETLYMDKLPSGVECYVLPKGKFVEKQAMIAIKYGSADNRYLEDGKLRETPEGVAHFLEHKMFEDEEVPVLEKFVSQGGNVNAFTTYTHTSYYFSCIDNFYENLDLLFSFVQTPHFTDENVEKEKGIISQEIKMYADTPSWRVYMNLHRALYNHGPIRDNIAGTIDSIELIDKGVLYDCYNAFYHPANMAVIAVGDIDPEEFAESVGKKIKPRKSGGIERLHEAEPKEAKMSYIEEKMAVSMPCFQFGFKETDFSSETAMKIASSKILADLVAGESSPLYGRMFDKGLIDGSFSMDYLCGSFYGATIFSGSSNEPIKVRELILEEISRISKEGVDPLRFGACKRKHLGRYLMSFDMISHMAINQVDLYSKGLDLFDLLNAFQNVSIDDVNDRLRSHLISDSSALSVVSPLEPSVELAV
jgi:predicted Zn-dependent peptidase